MPSLISDLPYDTLRDLTAVAQMVTYPSVLVVHPSIPARNVKELIALAKARPGALNYASGGIGTANHLGAELFKSMAKVNITHVGYKGGAPALIAVLSGEADLLFSTMPAAAAHLRNGRFRALAVTGPQRSALVPDVPTVSEAGLPGFEVVTWSGLLAPAKTPREVIARLNKSVNMAMSDPEVRARIADQATDVVIGTPEEFSAVMRKDSQRWARLIRDAGIKAE
jgi:tripartite-type tricarboxylate transporter receptor subunit TctC